MARACWVDWGQFPRGIPASCLGSQGEDNPGGPVLRTYQVVCVTSESLWALLICRAGVSSLWPGVCFCAAHQLRITFHFQRVVKTKKNVTESECGLQCTGSLSLGTVGLLGRIIAVCAEEEAVLSIVECLAASLASTH